MGRAAVNGRAARRMPVSALAAATVLRVDGRLFLYDARQNRLWETDEHGARTVEERRENGDAPALRLRYSAPASAFIPRAIEFVMTGACNLQCTYCATRERYRSAEGTYDGLDEATALRALELLRPHLPKGPLQVKFFGGEPLLCVGVIRRIIETLDSWGVDTEKIIATNGLLLDDETIDFLARGRFLTLISLDGVPEVHDANRRDARGRGSYDRVLERLNRFRKRYPDLFRTHVAVNMVVAPRFALRREKAAIREQIVQGEWKPKSSQSIFGDCYYNYGGLRPEKADQEGLNEEPPDAADGITLEDCQGYAWNIVTILPDGKVSACLEF